MPNEYKNHIDLREETIGKEKQTELISDILKNGTFLPNTVTYKDIDDAFKTWVEDELEITDVNGRKFPTMVLFSNQRFSEYTQSWKFTDTNNNLLLNFKSITRENNPNYGKIQNGYWNIPGKDRFYTMKKQIALDDNGSESLLVLKMRQPTAIDFNFKLSIFTTQYSSINEFNTKINQLFNARQWYIRPNNHYMPMTLENISDESSYNIDDRQFYGQTYQIKVMGYILTEDDYRVDEVPLKYGYNVSFLKVNRPLPDVEIEECEEDGKEKITIIFPEKGVKNVAEFKMDEDIQINEIKLDNIFNNYKIFINENKIDSITPIFIKENDIVKIVISKQIKNMEAKMYLFS